MYVEVTDTYRRPFVESGLEWMIHGNGFGKVLREAESKRNTPFKDEVPIPQYEVEWADGTVTTMAQSHLKQSTRKAFFQARLSC